MSAVDELSETQELSPSIAENAPTRPAADRFMRAMLRVNSVKKTQKIERSAHRNMQIAMIISGIRCIITYLAIPIAVPIIGLSGMVSAPIGIGLSVIAVVTGISSLRQFWRSDHKYRWMYTAFIGVIFLVLAIALVSDISTIVRAA